MAMYVGTEEVWKCQKHPSKRHLNGICPVCLRDRLIILCPDCASVRPCSCYAASSSSSSVSSSSSFFFFSSISSSRDSGNRVSDLIDREPAFRRSRSVGIPHIFSRFAADKSVDHRMEPAVRSKSKIAWFLSKFRNSSSRRRAEIEKNENESSKEIHAKNNFDEYVRKKSSSMSGDDFARIMMKSRSVHLEMTKSGDTKSPAVAKKAWSFPSPMKVFRHSSKASKVIQDRSPRVCRS